MESAQKRRVKRRETPDYRRIKVYSKSARQYWKERDRRKQVYKMFRAGKDLSEMAATLGACERTIQRDLVKLSPYIKNQLSREAEFLRQAQIAEIKSLSTEEVLKRLALLSRLMFRKPRPSKKEIYDSHNHVIKLNCDTPSGIPEILPIETTTKDFKMPFTIIILAIKNGKHHALGSITIG